MKLDKIMTREDSNETHIVLYRQGLFIRAYERSAYHLSSLCAFKVINKYVKYLKRDVVYSGFPESSLDRIKLTANSEGWVMSTHSEGVCFSKAVPDLMPDLEAFSVQFEQWRQQYLVPLLPVDKGISARQAEKYVMKKLKNFPVERKTPFEALQLIMGVKKVLELANG